MTNTILTGSRWESIRTGFDIVVLGADATTVDYAWVEWQPGAATITGSLPLWTFHQTFRRLP